MFLKRHVLVCVLTGLMTVFSTTIHASETVKISSSYDKNGVTLLFLGVAYEEVQKFLLDKQDVTMVYPDFVGLGGIPNDVPLGTANRPH